VAAASHIEMCPPLPSVRGMVLGPHPAFIEVRGGVGPHGSPSPPEADSATPRLGEVESSLGGRAGRIPRL
jgi:hypothetical protein